MIQLNVLQLLHLFVFILFLIQYLLLGEIRETYLNQMGITPCLVGPIWNPPNNKGYVENIWC